MLGPDSVPQNSGARPAVAREDASTQTEAQGPAPKSSSKSAKAKKTSKGPAPRRFLVVSGEEFASLSWFLGRTPTRREFAHCREFCLSGAVEFRGTKLGSLSAHLVQDAAAPGAVDLLADQVLTVEWKASTRFSRRASRGDVEFRLLPDVLEKKYSGFQQVVFRCDELEREFA